MKNPLKMLQGRSHILVFQSFLIPRLQSGSAFFLTLRHSPLELFVPIFIIPDTIPIMETSTENEVREITTMIITEQDPVLALVFTVDHVVEIDRPLRPDRNPIRGQVVPGS